MVAKADTPSEVQAMCTVRGHQGIGHGLLQDAWQVQSVQRREPNDESKTTTATDQHGFTNADLRYAGKLDDKQGGDTKKSAQRD